MAQHTKISKFSQKFYINGFLLKVVSKVGSSSYPQTLNYARNTHSSLLKTLVNYSGKKFYNTRPG
jgi:hypothetical protein